MKLKNHHNGYGIITLVIHWLMAVMIFGLFALGLWMTDLTYYDPWYREAPALHKSIGIVLLGLLAFRLFWRVINIKPQPLASHSTAEKMIAAWVHKLLYMLPFLVIVSGYMISTADGRPVSVFELFEIPAITTNIDNQEDVAGDIHFYLAWGLIGMAGLHAGAAIKHHVWEKDNTLKRMLGFAD